MNKISLQTLLDDYECVLIEDDGDGSSSIYLESPTNGDLLGIRINLPNEVIPKYDLRMYDRKKD